MTAPGALPDLRLAGSAAGAWATALACLYLPARGGLAVAGTAAGVVALVWLTGHRASTSGRGASEGSRWGGTVRRVGMAVLLGVVCAGTATAARVATRESQPLSGLAREHATVHMRLTIVDDPRPVRGVANRPATYAIGASAGTLLGADGSGVDLHARLLVLTSGPGWRDLLPGTPVVAIGRLSPPRGGGLTAAVLSVTSAPSRGPAVTAMA